MIQNENVPVDKTQLDLMAKQLVLHEGLRLRAYRDTLENWTIGVGYNLEARGVDTLEKICGRSFAGDYAALTMTAAEAMATLDADILRVESAVKVHWPPYAQLSDVRQRVVLDMAFNLGFRALTFKNALAALVRRDYTTAVKEIYRSKWAYQVDDGPGGTFGRADRLCRMLLTGNDYTS